MKRTETQLEKRQAGEVELTEDRPVFVPATDIYEKADAILVQCDLPGVDEKNLEITLEDNVLTITGRQAEETPEGYDLVLSEYRSGVFRRSFTISNEIDNDGIKARIRNGVLNLELPKAAKAPKSPAAFTLRSDPAVASTL